MFKLFGTDGIRGVANRHPVTPEIALRLGKALGHVMQSETPSSKRVLIGKDTRLSGYMLETALTSGLVSSGMNVFLVGPLPTPAVAHLTHSMNAAVGIMLTASHNPFDDNGIKLFDSQGFKLRDDVEEKLTDAIMSGSISSDHIRSEKLGKAHRIEDARGRYIEFAKNSIGSHTLQGIKIALDCANGAAYRIGPWIFEELGAEVIELNTDPDGFNINDQCGAMHPECISREVKSSGADLGIAFDGDADRVIFCDENGRVIDGDRVLGMCALHLKEHDGLRNNTIVVTSMSNLGLIDAMRNNGIETEITDVGDRYVIDRMRAQDHNLGGEKSGHLIFMDYATTGDGIISALQVLRLMKEKSVPVSELADCMEEYPQKLTGVKVARKTPIDEIIPLTQAIQDCQSELGDVGRAIVRYSGTEPKIRILVEAQDASLVDKWTTALTEIAETELGQ